MVTRWAGGRLGNRVTLWYTHRTKQVAHALRRFSEAIGAGDLSHSGNETLIRHVGNAVRRPVVVRDDEGRPLWTVGKRKADAKIDGLMAAVLAWEARRDSLEAGERPYRAGGFA